MPNLSSIAVPVSIFLSIAICTAPARSDSGTIRWKTDLEEALVEANRTNRNVLLQVTATWCHFCERMLEETMSRPEVAEEINANYVPLLIDADDHPDIVRRVGIRAFPTTVIIAPSRRIIDRNPGYKTPSMLLPYLAQHKPEVMDSPVAPASTAFASAEAPLAYNGYCPVTLLEEELLKDGKGSLETTYEGAVYRFVTKAHRDRFNAEPDRYLPALGGHCPVCGHGTADGAKGDPETATIYLGRIWLLKNIECQRKFVEDVESYLPAGIEFTSE
ncbi:Thiol:disulfide interchange protein DsbD [Planctomycetes bacterium Pan216]|uniref:Thiol:disulfide interchange protein DsbD n=1 Tax=Kolteria novifilia TaxID=2527975 RepID=A0A518AZD1_9BACT|nr:Thiol:disulfide interchange protein DsbD [Planctomycetes bacterium Pan216]